MEKKKPTTTTNHKGVCEKLFDAVSVTPAFRSIRRLSHHPQPQGSVPPDAPSQSLPPSSGAKTSKPEKSEPVKGGHVVVHTKADPLPPPVATKERVKPIPPPVYVQETSETPKISRNNIGLAPTPASEHAHEKPKKKVVEIATQVKAVVQQTATNTEAKVVEATTKGEGGRKSALTNINEKATDYLSRAKNKIRSTTMAGGGGGGGKTTSY